MPGARSREEARRTLRILRYLCCGRRPWSVGYDEFKRLRRVLRDRVVLGWFRAVDALPRGYSRRLDERVIEYPWLVARLGEGRSLLLDAGGALNHGFLLKSSALRRRTMVVCTLSNERPTAGTHASCVRADLRRAALKDEVFDEVVCISTLDHVGLDQTRVYLSDERWRESHPEDYTGAVRELRRVLKPGGRLFVTVPYLRYENLGWMQQFDAERLARIADVFAPASYTATFYRCCASGWQLSDAAECSTCAYFDIHTTRQYGEDYAAAARAVACLELVT